MVGLQTLDLAIGVRVPASQPKNLFQAGYPLVGYTDVGNGNAWKLACQRTGVEPSAVIERNRVRTGSFPLYLLNASAFQNHLFNLHIE
jgi:hypothetical protein